MDLVTEYLKLGLRFDRVVDGFVDAYIGDPLLKQQVADEPAPDPAELSRTASRLSVRLGDTDLPADRREFLAAHLGALAVSGRRLAGEDMSFIEEVHSYFQVEISEIDVEVYAAAHREIDALLDQAGAAPNPVLAERLAAVRAQEACPPELVETAVRAIAAALRGPVVAATGLPEQETIDFDIERDVAWSGFNYYLGGFSSRVAVNADVGHRMSQFPVLVAHECYPGHHTEHCRKEKLLVDEGGQAEQTIFLVNTPQCLMAEGLGDLALTAAIGPGWGHWAADVLDGIGPRFDPELAEALEIASRPLNTVRQNAAIMLHDRGADPDDVLAYLRRWGLADEKRAGQMLRFLSDPLWRAYTSTYVEGERLLRPWLEARPAGQSAMDRFRRLLDEPLTPAAIQAEQRDLGQGAGARTGR
ncbi:hypothetical protein SAMN04515671_0478 [Nakamurella panacisegetis]|uniref:DUF885 domain-containing protein n=1 Tax=Nakamurella panacisegetis TaxID=1090615 RepID=A0A1H0IEV8_9ACTN|nr:DUF885 domain-containing protein [Nakamurella panacisegetis]SDO29933.1 hypothetical protein SAMN04515671_0478 [Nakamurella panacisegetis]